MSSRNRKEYETSNIIDQAFLNNCHDNLVNQLEMVAEISLPSGSGFLTDTIYVSDRNKYVGQHFYDARVKFPPISRTIGEIISPVVEFSSIKLNINNADGKFNSVLPGGANFAGIVGQNVKVRMGLRDVEATYITIFEGTVSEVGGFGRTTESFFISARDKFDKLKTTFPTTVFTEADYPDVSASVVGKGIPYILGDWTVNLNPASGSSIPAFPINGANASVLAGTTNVDLIISVNVNTQFNSANVVLQRGDEFFPFNAADVTTINIDKNRFQIKQGGSGGITSIDGSPWTFKEGDKIWTQVKGKDLGSGGIYNNNAVEQARDLLLTYGGAVGGDFDSSWDAFRDKAAPAFSAVFNIKSRVWAQKVKPALQSALSLLEQVRLEAFIARSQLIKITSLHWEDFEDAPAIQIENWDVELGSFTPQIDQRNNINRAKSFYNFLPDFDGEFSETGFFRNQPSIDQAKLVEKGLVFPNLHVRIDVENQTKELMKITSGWMELPTCGQTWRSLLIDIGDFVQLKIDIGGIQFDGVPCMVRDVSYIADGLKLKFKYWSFLTSPYKAWAGVGGGIITGQNATITEEV